jgi:predicted N-formylglutamate amidohydrolase
VATKTSLVVTCEHGGNDIPVPYRRLFRRWRAVLASHRGYDSGALIMAQALAEALDVPLVSSTISRLLVDLNRSIGNPRLYSTATKNLPAAVRATIVAEHYVPYRRRVEEIVARKIIRGRRVIHVSSHSFTPNLDGNVRRADVGLLYDPGRRGEVELCARWKAALATRAPELRVRRNYPYAGKGDGLTSHLRRQFPASQYIGIELEINQKLVQPQSRQWLPLRRALIDALRSACAGSGSL